MQIQTLAVKALRIFSEDTNPTRHMQQQLCRYGAAAALGGVLKHITPPHNVTIISLASLPDGCQLLLYDALCALANIFDFVRQETDNSTSNTTNSLTRSTSLEHDLILFNGWWQVVKDECLPAILNMIRISLPSYYTVSEEITLPMHSSSHTSKLTKAACRLLASMCPLLSLTPRTKGGGVATPGSARYALLLLQALLKRLVRDDLDDAMTTSKAVQTEVQELLQYALQGILALAAQSDPLKICIMDQTTPYLLQAMKCKAIVDSPCSVRDILVTLVPIVGTMDVPFEQMEPSLLVDMFCLERSLLIQAMARAEIRKVVLGIWEQILKDTFPGMDSIQQHTNDASARATLFQHLLLADHATTKATCDRLMEQYLAMYPNLRKETDKANESVLLKCQEFPLCSTFTEAEWILQHREYMVTGKLNKNVPNLSEHVDKLLKRCFPSGLLKEKIIPVCDFCPDASFDFRVLLMPNRHYDSFEWESKMLLPIYKREEALLADGLDRVHISLAFTNSSFSENFAKYLVEFLEQCPGIRGISFANCDLNSIQNVYGSSWLANLVSSPHISHLTFEGILNKHLVSIMDTVSQHPASLAERKAGRQSGGCSFLAISRSPSISPNVWSRFFHSITPKGARPNSSSCALLKSLDLSFNNLGDGLCSTILRIAFQNNSCLEELDLSGNQIGRGTAVINQLESRKMRAKLSLKTLKLASNNLNIEDAWVCIVAFLQEKNFTLRFLDLSSNDIFLEDPEQTDVLIQSISLNQGLTRLNLSNNMLSSVALDAIFRAVSESTINDSLIFLELEHNKPPLTEQQLKCFGSLSMRTKRHVVDRHLREFNELTARNTEITTDNMNDSPLLESAGNKGLSKQAPAITEA